MKNSFILLISYRPEKTLVAFSIVIFSLYHLMPFFWSRVYSFSTLNLLVQNGLGAILSDISMFFLALIIFNFASRVLLLLDVKSSGFLFVSTQLLFLLISLLGGMAVSPPVDAFLGYILALTDEAILFSIFNNKVCLAKKEAREKTNTTNTTNTKDRHS